MKKPTKEEVLNLWLKYHNTNVAELLLKHSKEVLSSPDWFKLYPCTQEQHDLWMSEVKALFKDKYKMRKWYIENAWGLLYLDCSPYVKTLTPETSDSSSSRLGDAV